MSKLMRTCQWVSLALMALAFLAPSSSFAASRPDLVVAVNKLPRSLEPVEKTGNVDVRAHYSTFDTLFRRDFINPNADGLPTLKPSLATSWKWLNKTTLEVKLRKDVKFHNGETMTADDIVFTFSKNRMRGKRAVLPTGRRYFGHLEAVKKIDDHTVQFISKKPDLVLEQRLATYAAWIVSKKQWMKYKEEGTEWAKTAKPEKKKKKTKKKKKKKKLTLTWMHYALKKIRFNPVGTGPLKFVSWKKNQYIKYQANDDYFMGKPAFKTLTFKVVPEMATRIAGLVSGEFDIIVDVAPDQFKVLNRYKDIKVHSVVLENTHMLVFPPAAKNLKDKRLRQALSLAIDRAKLRKTFWDDRNYTPLGHQLPNFGQMYNPKRKGYSYDPEKAKQLVKASGYDGRSLTFRVIPDYYLNGKEAAQVLQQMWKAVGINVDLKFVDNFKQVRAKGVEIYAWSNTHRLPDPTGSLMITWGDRAAIQRKYKLWKAPEAFNKGLKKILTTADPKKRFKTFQKVLDIYEDEMPGTMLYNPLYSYAAKKNIQWTAFPILFMDFRPDVLKINK